MELNIYTFNEWKESDDYHIQRRFIDMKQTAERWFETDELEELEFDYFEFDSTHTYGAATANLFFNEAEIQWKLSMSIDVESMQDGEIDEIRLVLNGYRRSDNSHLGMVESESTADELNPELIISMINQFKIEHVPDEDDSDDVQRLEA